MSRALVVCAHGTDDPAGQAVVHSLTDQVADRLPGVEVRTAYVDVQRPRLAEVVGALAGRHESVVVVPLLLSYGYHVEVDVAEAVAAYPHVVARGQLGPHPLLAEVLHDRLLEAGATCEQPVVLGVAGSSRRATTGDAERMRCLLGRCWRAPVRLGYLAAATPSVADAVAETPGAAVASYLVGPGFFHRRLQHAGADLVSAPLGDDPRLAQLVAAGLEAERPSSRDVGAAR